MTDTKTEPGKADPAVDKASTPPAKTDPAKTDPVKTDKGKEPAPDSAAVHKRADELTADGMGRHEAKARAEAEVAQAERDGRDAKEREKARAKAGPLAPAGQSGDPAVQQLLAQRQGHVTNLAGLRPVPDEAAARIVEGAIADIDERLADMGYTAQ